MPFSFTTALQAAEWLRSWVGLERDDRPLKAVLREAQRTTHPDLSGDAETFHRVSLAEAKLREGGLL